MMYRTYVVDIVEGKRVTVSYGNTRIETYSGPFLDTAQALDKALNFIYEAQRRYLVCFAGASLLNVDRFYVTTLPFPEDEESGIVEDPGATTTIQR